MFELNTFVLGSDLEVIDFEQNPFRLIFLLFEFKN